MISFTKSYLLALAGLLLTINSYAQDSLIINEFMASNESTLMDEDGDYSDWIEVYNAGSSDINLNGWHLTDDATTKTKWRFPDSVITPGSYVLVFASGKNRISDENYFHSNFKLSASGEYLALVKPSGVEVTTEFMPAYPVQYKDLSYGFYNNEWSYNKETTPGASNIDSRYIFPPTFNKQHGLFYESFDLELISSISGGEIYYTTNSNTPSVENGILYNAPIPIETSTVIRAITISDDGNSDVVTQTYIFPDSVINQTSFPEGYPEKWLQPINYTDSHEYISSHYGMIETIVENENIKANFDQALKDLPIVSIVSDIDNFFSTSEHPDSGGIYMYTGASDGSTRSLNYHLGRGWVRPGSVEYFNEDGSSLNFQSNCALKIHGGASRTPWKTTKYSFKIGFKSEYGPSKLKEPVFGEDAADQFDWLILRGGFATRYGLQIYDPWAKKAYQDMGQYAANNKFVHVYLNGMYWGMYNLSERMDDNCMRDYFGGNEEDYDIIKDYFEVEAGDTIKWTEMMNLVMDNISDNDNYQLLLGNNPDGSPNPSYEKYLNIESLADYILLNFYSGNKDWDHHNWLAARNRVDPDGFVFIPWDMEKILSNSNDNSLSIYNENRPTAIFHALIENEQFQDFFISRINKHLFEGGALIPEKSYNRYTDLRAPIDTAVICESARWAYSEKSDLWENSYHTFIDSYFPTRTEKFFKQLIARRWYPNIEMPILNTGYRKISHDFELAFNELDAGEILYTLNGDDPGYLSSDEADNVITYDGGILPILPGDTLHIKARTRLDTLWSAVLSKTIIVEQLPTNAIPFAQSNISNIMVYPNPLANQSSIRYSLKTEANINISIYTIAGNKIETIANEIQQGGDHQYKWNTSQLSPGMYFMVIENKTIGTRKQIKLIKK